MIKKIIIFLSLLFVLCSCNLNSNKINDNNLKITGDVIKEFDLVDYKKFNIKKINYNDKEIEVINLNDVINSMSLVGQNFTVIIDKNIEEFNLEDINDLYLYKLDEKWNLIKNNQDIKDIKKIVIKANDLNFRQKCLRIINGKEDYAFSYGALYLQANDDGYISLNQYHNNQKTAIAYSYDGNQIDIDPNGYLKYEGNKISYVDKNKENKINDIIGIWFDYPELSVKDLGQFVFDHPNDKIMLIELDGYGYMEHLFHKPEYLSSLEAKKMRTIMPSISNVGLATIITGQYPSQNGISKLNQRTLTVNDIFMTHKNPSIVEGDAELIDMSIKQILNFDDNLSGSNDDEVYNCAKKIIKENHDLIYVHFHGFDDFAHKYGPYTIEAKDKIDELDKYVKDLVSQFNGYILISSDHGQHDKEARGNLGNHGEFILEDMLVPFFMIDNRN